MVYRGYDREDGLWDIEAELTDIKPYTFRVPNERPFPAQEPIHHLLIRVTLDDEMLIHDIVTSMDSIPHAECSGAPVNMHKFKGLRMGPGWRKLIQEHLGGTAGCTHLREMLFNMATAAFQTLPSGQWWRREQCGEDHPPLQEPAFFLNQCHSWAYHSPTVQRSYPMFYKPKASEPASGDN